MRKILPNLTLFAITALISQPAFSKGLYTVDISSGRESVQQDYSSISNMLDATKQKNISAILKGYNQNSDLEIKANVGNIPAYLQYSPNSTTLDFKMDCAGITKSFSGSSRTISENQFRDYIDRNDVREKIDKCIKEGDASGSSNSSNFPSVINFPGNYNKTGTATETRSIGVSFEQYSIGSQTHNVITLPLSYTHYYEEPGRTLTLAAPISYIDINGSKTYKVNLGAAYTRPINDKWTIIPAASLGITASHDMGTSSTILSAAVTNRYEFPVGKNHVTLANSIGALTSLDMKVGRLRSYGNFDNQIVKNGVSVEVPQSYHMLGGKTSVLLSVANTQYFGDKLYINKYTDFAVSMGTRRKVGGVDNSQDSMQIGLTYTIGNRGYKGGKLNFGYDF